jgi:hypothetical protein
MLERSMRIENEPRSKRTDAGRWLRSHGAGAHLFSKKTAELKLGHLS